MNQKTDSLISLEHKIADNKLISMFPSATNLVFGEGNPDAKVLFIGEAPGKNEDLKAKPFVGASGKILDQALSDINLKRSDVYITNIVKYRPDDNRDPSDEEKNIFLPFLIAQILIIQPRLLVTLGRHSMSCFIKNGTINALHGKLTDIDFSMFDFEFLTRASIKTFKLLPLFHPAATIYNRSLKETWNNDFKMILNYI